MDVILKINDFCGTLAYQQYFGILIFSCVASSFEICGP